MSTEITKLGHFEGKTLRTLISFIEIAKTLVNNMYIELTDDFLRFYNLDSLRVHIFLCEIPKEELFKEGEYVEVHKEKDEEKDDKGNSDEESIKFYVNVPDLLKIMKIRAQYDSCDWEIKDREITIKMVRGTKITHKFTLKTLTEEAGLDEEEITDSLKQLLEMSNPAVIRLHPSILLEHLLSTEILGGVAAFSILKRDDFLISVTAEATSGGFEGEIARDEMISFDVDEKAFEELEDKYPFKSEISELSVENLHSMALSNEKIIAILKKLITFGESSISFELAPNRPFILKQSGILVVNHYNFLLFIAPRILTAVEDTWEDDY